MATTDEDTDWYITGPRLNVYHMVPFFLDARNTEQYIAESFGLTIEQIARARSYVFNNFEKVMKRHWEIEAQIARDMEEQAKWYTPERQAETRRSVETLGEFLKAQKIDKSLFVEVAGEAPEARRKRLRETATAWKLAQSQKQLEVA